MKKEQLEKAKKTIESAKNFAYDDAYKEAFDCAIEAIKLIEQPPCKDAISRQALLEYFENKYYAPDDSVGIEFDVEDVLEDIKEFQSVTPYVEWIPVEKELPNTSRNVQVTLSIEGENVFTAYYNEKIKEWEYCDVDVELDYEDGYVVAWRELPEGYKESKEGENKENESL